MEEVVEEGVRVLHRPTALLVSILPDTNAEGRPRTRKGLAGGIVVVDLGHGKRGILLAQLL